MNIIGLLLLIGCVALTIYTAVGFFRDLRAKKVNKPPTENKK